MVKKNTIPDGWRSVTPIGQPIPGTRFIAFKVPLKGAINQRLTPTQKFTPKDLIAAVKALNVELGLVIDLTYTTRYYEVKDLPKSVQYKKLYTVGLEVPDNATILQFKKWVRKFLWENAGNEKLIGVHCTNGINRTGYLICRYLVDVEGWDPETAIQAFGDARGHHMDGLVYLTDLRTQPMRSNLGMDVWDSDEDIIPPPHAMEGPVERFPNEDFQGSGKRLRIYDDHSHNDLQGQIPLRDFDFINKGSGQRPFHDSQAEDNLRAPMQMRNWDYNRGPGQRRRPFRDHQFYEDYQEDVQLKDPDFSNNRPGQRLRPFDGHQFHDECNKGRGQRQRSSPDHPSHNDLQEDRQSKDFGFRGRGRGQRRRPFHDHQSHDEFQTQMQLNCVNKGPGQRLRSFHDYQLQDDLQPQMELGEFEFINRGCGQRSRPFNDPRPHNDLQTEMQLKDYDNKGPGQRHRPFHDHQPYDDLQEQTQLKDFDYFNKGHGQRPRPFHDHPGHDDLPHEWCSDRRQSFSFHENVPDPHFSSSPPPHRDYGSDNDDFNRSYSNRLNCPEDNRRMHPSDEFSRGKNRFAPYSSRTMHSSSSVHQEDSSIDYERKLFQGETTRETEQSKRLPVVAVDYNYGLPLDYGPEEGERKHYDLPPRDCYNWN
ncbi:RNA/RNP complex-1-interacting phosphatase isoform X2 [Colius striatus]|uniref:RNA/RNP complex-1-interacting phosphatase isoform X2 n=1 Tax=Colius striatus TaxID=57412 RepID=UPI002B1DEA7B|nr:RNA/RNP complex-1-interacting phosphatase isoform X2 [Colius striatus]XP_061857644.1 RNA/RNP complex-1-interacting phosphatase isoform X2 [Colius striatus]